MEQKNSNLAILREPFVAGMDENLSPIMHRLWNCLLYTSDAADE